MPPRAVSRFAVPRYRTRLLVARLAMGRPPTLHLVNLGLAVIGAWSIIYQVIKFVLPDNPPALVLAVAGVAAATSVMALIWLRVAHRPQDLFRSAARSENRAEALRQQMVAGMRQEFAYENLVRLYAPIVEQVRRSLPAARIGWPSDATGKRCLVITIAAPQPQQLSSLLTELEGPRGADWTKRVSRFAPERQAFMATMRRSVSLANMFGDEAGSNIVLTKISASPALTMSVNTATYGQIMRTSDSLVNEFAVFAHHAYRSAFRRRPMPLVFEPRDLLKVLPWRRQVHSWDDEDALLVAPRRRASGVGVSLSVVDARSGPASVFVARRSSNVGTYPDVLHVVPSGMMNVRGDLRQSAGELAGLPRLAMMSEFLEECFDIAEFSGHSLGNFAKRVAEELKKRRLHDLEPQFTGLALDLLNLRTDVCGSIDLTAHPPVLDAFNLSWEYTHTERLHRIEIESEALTVRRADFVQAGIGSIYLAALSLAARRAAAAGPP